ncbi:cupin domain-containing protein [Fodinicola feengrottensis]|uniref:Cupin domain-containing protein n=2 Tax=Fodinicola feengrottensis TaxID=435914 RepID=A0ABP4U9C5_9ACTN
MPKIHVDSVEPNRRRGGELRVLLSPKTAASTSGFMGVVRLAPGESISEHYHPYSEEFLYVVSGHLQMRLDDEKIDLGPGESLMVPIDARHRLENSGTEPAEGVFFLSPLAPRPELGHVDTEEQPNQQEPQLSVSHE